LRRRFTVGRAFALLIMGVAVGVGIFLAKQLDPTGIELRVREALADFLQHPFELKAVVPRLGRGVELLGLEVHYADGGTAIHVERVLLEVDHERLLEGDVHIPRIELSGLTLMLRAPGPDHTPGLPDVFREPRTAAGAPLPAKLPEITVARGGRNRVLLGGLPFLDAGERVEIRVEYAEGQHDGPTYRVEAALAAESLGRAEATVTYEPLRGIFAARLVAPQISWNEALFDRLSPEIRSELAALRTSGRAEAIVEAHAGIADRRIDYLYAHARLDGVEGRFGNLYAADPAGFPFAFRGGRGMAVLDGGRLKLHDLVGTYVSRDGREGRVSVSFDAPLASAAEDLDLHLSGEGIHATTGELRLLLPPPAVATVVDKYEPGGTVEFDVRVRRRPGLPESVAATLVLREGRFEYAGRLDPSTGRRHGFRYPLEEVSGRIVVEGGVRTEHGVARIVTLDNVRGTRRRSSPGPGAPANVRVTAEGRIVTYTERPGAPEDVEVSIVAEDLPIDDDLAAAFRSTKEGVPYRAFDLQGRAKRVHVRLHASAFDDPETHADYTVTLADCAISYPAFPLHIEGLSGTIVSRSVLSGAEGGPGRAMQLVGLVGHARDGGLVTAEGTVRQAAGGSDQLDVRVRADDLALGPDMAQAVARASLAGRPGADVWRLIRPSGRVDADIRVRSAERADVDVLLDGAAELGGYGRVDFPVRELRGRVAYRDGGIALRGIEARLPRGTASAEGEIRPDGTLSVRATLHRLGCDARLLALLKEAFPAFHAAARAIEPADESALDVSIEATRALPGRPVRFRADAAEIDLAARVAGVPFRIRGGPARLGEDGFATGELWLDSGASQVHVRESQVSFGKGAGSRVLFDARGLEPGAHLAPLLDARLAEALGARTRVDLEAFELAFDRPDGKIVMAGAVDLRRVDGGERDPRALEPTGALELAPVTVVPEAGGASFSGLVRFRGLDLHLPADITNLNGQLLVGEGRFGDAFALRGAVVEGEMSVLGRTVRAASMNLAVDPYYVRLSELEASFYDGSLAGAVEVHLGEPAAFQLRLRAKDVDLQQFLRGERPSEDPMGGRLDFALDLQSPSGKPEHLAGRGDVRVREGALFDVPFFRTILALLGRIAPIDNRPRFRNAAIDFVVRGETIEVQNLHLSTPVSDIYASGEATIYGDLDLVIRPQVNRILDLPRFLDIPVLSALRNLWHRTVYEVRLAGTIESPRLELRALPFFKAAPRAIPPSPHGGRVERMRPGVLP